MTNEKAFETLKVWARAFGCDIIEADEESFPENLKKNRGLFRRVQRSERMLLEEYEIWLKSGLPMEEKIEVMAHELSHLALTLLKVEPYQSLTHEPTASILGKCLLAVIQDDYKDPLFNIGGVATLVHEFLKLLKGKIDRTSLNLALMDQEYFRWKAEHDKMADGG